jgi:hypothetical protein
MPPVQLDYSRTVHDPMVHEVDLESLENLPHVIENGIYQFVDLNRDGANGVLAQTDGFWMYKSPLGNGKLGPARPIKQAAATSVMSI